MFSFFFFSLLGTVSCQSPSSSIIETAQNVDDLSILVAILEDDKFSDVATALSGDGPFTVFAPKNEAFLAVIEALSISADPADWDDATVAVITQTLYFHVLSGALKTENFTNRGVLTTLETGRLVSMQLPDDGGWQVSNALVETADVECSNGVVHIVDQVLLPGSLMDFVLSTDELSSLASTLSLFPDLVQALAGLGEWTLFAPIDSAFEAISSVAETLSLEQVKRILSEHVVTGAKSSEDLAPTYWHRSSRVTTLDGGVLKVSERNDHLYVDKAKVIEADQKQFNGVAHTIDAVLLPSFLDGGVQDFGSCDEVAQSWYQCKEAASIFLPEVAYPHPIGIYQSHRPAGCYYKPGNDEHEQIFYNYYYHGDAECTTERQCLCAELGPPPPTQTLAELVNENEKLSILYDILTSGPPFDVLADAASSPGDLTVFAPEDQAFTRVLEAVGLSSDPSEWTDDSAELIFHYVQYHILPFSATSSALKRLQFPHTLLDSPDFVNRGGDAQVVKVAKDRDTGAVTVSPASDGVANVIEADLLATNGVLHVIDDVLVPPSTLLETLNGADQFRLFLTLLDAYDLEELNGEPSLTFFVPEDEAFAPLVEALGPEILDADPNEDYYPVVLAALQNHVAPGVAFSSDLQDRQKIPTLSDGEELRVNIDYRDGSIELETGSAYNDDLEAEVITEDVILQNGVLHVISNVLVPGGPASIKTSGSCAASYEHHGDCNDAADEVGFDDIHADTIWWRYRPTGCFYDEHYGKLYLNKKHTDVECSDRFKCLCSGNE